MSDRGGPLPIEREGDVLQVMAEVCSDGLWRPGCGEEDAADFGIPAALAKRLAAWSALYSLHCLEDLREWSGLDAFVADGLDIARQIQTVVAPKWRVIYFDEAKYAAGLPREEFLYLVSADRRCPP